MYIILTWHYLKHLLLQQHRHMTDLYFVVCHSPTSYRHKQGQDKSNDNTYSGGNPTNLKQGEVLTVQNSEEN